MSDESPSSGWANHCAVSSNDREAKESGVSEIFYKGTNLIHEGGAIPLPKALLPHTFRRGLDFKV